MCVYVCVCVCVCVCIWVWRVSDQNGISLLYIMLEIYRSGQEPSMCERERKSVCVCVCMCAHVCLRVCVCSAVFSLEHAILVCL